MRHKRFVSVITLGSALLAGRATTALAQRETVIPQVADGAGAVRTKLDITNLSSAQAISKLRIFFFQRDGTPWTLATNQGTASQFLLSIGKNQVFRVETLGSSQGVTSGYAILRNSEGNPQNAADFRASVSVFYEILTDGRVTDTVSVPVGQPTLRWTVPVEIDAPKSLYSGLALVNLASTSNTVTLKLWNSYPPFDGDASDGGTATITLPPREQRARFLVEQGLFPDKVNFKGVLVGTAEKPVAVLGLLQTSTPGGVQYSTLAAEYLDALVTESSVYLPDGMVLDADVPRVPYVTRDDSGSSDFLYQFISTTVRYLVPQNGATFASLGRLSANEFNNLTIEDLQSRSYSATTIDVSDFTGNLAVGLSIAIRTSLGRVAKVRVAQIVVGSVSKDLALQIYVYR